MVRVDGVSVRAVDMVEGLNILTEDGATQVISVGRTAVRNMKSIKIKTGRAYSLRDKGPLFRTYPDIKKIKSEIIKDILRDVSEKQNIVQRDSDNLAMALMNSDGVKPLSVNDPAHNAVYCGGGPTGYFSIAWNHGTARYAITFTDPINGIKTTKTLTVPSHIDPQVPINPLHPEQGFINFPPGSPRRPPTEPIHWQDMLDFELKLF